MKNSMHVFLVMCGVFLSMPLLGMEQSEKSIGQRAHLTRQEMLDLAVDNLLAYVDTLTPEKTPSDVSVEKKLDKPADIPSQEAQPAKIPVVLTSEEILNQAADKLSQKYNRAQARTRYALCASAISALGAAGCAFAGAKLSSEKNSNKALAANVGFGAFVLASLYGFCDFALHDGSGAIHNAYLLRATYLPNRYQKIDESLLNENAKRLMKEAQERRNELEKNPFYGL